MNSAMAVDDPDAARERCVRRRTSRVAPSTANRRQTTGSNGQHSSVQQQVESDEALARRLQMQYDRQYRAEQNRRRQREAAAARRQTRAQANSHRPPTPPLPLFGREYEDPSDDYEHVSDGDDEDEHVWMEHDSPYRSRPGRTQRNVSPNGPTTLAVVRRYFQEAHLDASLFPDGSVMDYEALLELADELVEGAPTMSPAEINRLPTSVYRNHLDAESSSSASGSNSSMVVIEDAPTCPICMETFKDGHLQRILPCLHSYHKECVDVWLKQRSSCPVCRLDARSPGSP